jgi:16S rRNA (cytosine1402-N4)-methyltransferase
MQIYHKPIMVNELMAYLSGFSEMFTVDCNLGEGGHAEQVLERKPGNLIGIEQDEQILLVAKERLKRFEDRVTFVHDNYHNLSLILRNEQGAITGIYFDLGASSFHYEASGRGFSFRKDEPLDMRMDTRVEMTAETAVNRLPYEKLCQVLWAYGEERHAKRIAAAVVRERQHTPIRRSKQLADLIEKAVPRRGARIHPATRTFQALRILVNNELDIMEKSLVDAVNSLKVGGRICVISFHSLEDRIVKHTFRRLAKGCTCGPQDLRCNCPREGTVKVLTKKPITPSSQEVETNPRSRSAKLRVAERISEVPATV